MLLSILIELSALHSTSILGSLGRPIQAWFLRQLPTRISKQIHDSPGQKPYTVSSLINRLARPLPAGKRLQSGDVCWLRITTLDAELSSLLLSQVLPNLPDRLQIHKMNFRLNGYTLDPAQHNWANRTSYAEFAQRSGPEMKSGKVRMEFISPTTFRSDGVDLPFPLPEHVFRSYWLKWNRFAPAHMHVQDIWPAFAANCVTVSELTGVNTDHWLFSEGTRGGATGFTGTVSFSLAPQQHRPAWEPYWNGADHVLRTLAAYAFYCGTGYRTTWGMGQTRVIG